MIDIEYLRGAFRISDTVEDERISPYLKPAARRLKKWVGEETYGSDDEDIADILKTAEGLLAMHYLVLNLNTSVRPEGLVRTEQVEGNVTLSYLSATETGSLGQMYIDQAIELLDDLNLKDGTPGTPFAGS